MSKIKDRLSSLEMDVQFLQKKINNLICKHTNVEFVCDPYNYISGRTVIRNAMKCKDCGSILEWYASSIDMKRGELKWLKERAAEVEKEILEEIDKEILKEKRNEEY